MAFSSHQEAKLNGFFSRRHQSAEAHFAVREANKLRTDAKYEGASARQAASDRLSTVQKIARLPKTGAVRERARLEKRLASEKTSTPKPKASKVEAKGQSKRGK